MAGETIMSIAYGLPIQPKDDIYIETAEQGVGPWNLPCWYASLVEVHSRMGAWCWIPEEGEGMECVGYAYGRLAFRRC